MTDATKPSVVWELAGKNMAAIRGADIAAEISYVLRCLAEQMPDLYSGSPAPRKTKEEMVEFTRGLSVRVAEPCLQARCNFLATGIEIGNRDYKWDVPLVPQLIRLKKPLNWATKENFTRRHSAAKLEQAFGRDLEQPLSESPSVHFGQLLFSAMFYGALLEGKWLEPFLMAVAKKEIYQYNGILWVEMTRTSTRVLGDKQKPETPTYTKRFFPDYFTQTLIYRLLDHGMLPVEQPLAPWTCLQSYLPSLPGLSKSELPAKFLEFQRLALSRNLLLPGSLLSYATGRVKSTSLAIGPWLRCISGRAVRVERPVTTLNLEQYSEPVQVTAPRKLSLELQEKLFDELMAQIDPDVGEISGKEMKAAFEQLLVRHRRELSPAFQLLLYWGRQLLSPRASHLEHRFKKEALRPSSIRRYFSALGVPFLMAAGDAKLTVIDELELELVYEQTITNHKTDNMTPQCLLQFHGFLQAYFGLPPVESLELKAGTGGESNLNANLITLPLYELALQGLGWGNGKLSRWQQVRIIAFIFCFRCGLRPAEVVKLRIRDFQIIGRNAFELVIRGTPKTLSGRRRNPATLRMNGDESRFVLEYARQRSTEVGYFGDDYFLAHPAQKFGRLDDEDVYGQTRKLLRGISGDDTLRLYHSRHTYNSGLQVQFHLKGRPLFNQPRFLDLEISPEEDMRLRCASQGNENLGRKDQFVQAIIVGHASPDVTNKYYNHLTDALLGTRVRQQRHRISITLKAMIALSNLQQSWAGELLVKGEGNSLAGLVQVQAKKYADTLLHPLLKGAKPLALPKMPATKESSIPPWEEAVSDTEAQSLRRGVGNWEMAYNIYEAVRMFDDKRLKTVSKIVSELCSQLQNPARRWRGPVYASIGELRSFLRFLADVEIDGGAIALIHHQRRGQTEEEMKASLELWQSRIDFGGVSWLKGEPANKTASKKGSVEVRIFNSNGSTPLSHAMSKGFEVALIIIHRVLQKYYPT